LQDKTYKNKPNISWWNDEEKAWANYCITGRELVDLHLKHQEMLDKAIAQSDYDIPVHNYVEAEYLTEPDCLRLFVDEYPPRLKVFAAVVGVHRQWGYGAVRRRWWKILDKALEQLPYPPQTFQEPVAVCYRFFYPQPNIDIDQYAIKFINDYLVMKRILPDDNFLHMKSCLIFGQVSEGKHGTEVFVSSMKKLPKLLRKLNIVS
jgi:hypothetical protein